MMSKIFLMVKETATPLVEIPRCSYIVHLNTVNSYLLNILYHKPYTILVYSLSNHTSSLMVHQISSSYNISLMLLCASYKTASILVVLQTRSSLAVD